MWAPWCEALASSSLPQDLFLVIPPSPTPPDSLVTHLLSGGSSLSPALKPEAELKLLTVTSSWDSSGFSRDSVVNQ